MSLLTWTVLLGGAGPGVPVVDYSEFLVGECEGNSTVTSCLMAAASDSTVTSCLVTTSTTSTVTDCLS